MLEWLFGKKKQPQKQKQKKPKKNQHQQQAEDKWMYEFVVQFLNSPIWRVSILDFVDTKCIQFDNQQQNKFQYTTIHNQFKKLVGNLFDGMMQEVGLSEDKLVEILEKGFVSKQKKLFNQLLLCDDFLKFKDLMLRRNKTLQTEALNIMNESDIRKKSRLDMQRDMIRQSQINESSRHKKMQQQQQQILRKVLQMSRKQAQQRQAIQKLQIQAAQSQFLKNQQRLKREKEQKLKKQKQQAQKQKIQKVFSQNSDDQETFELKSKVNRRKKLNKLGSKQGDLPPLKGPNRKQFFQQDQPISKPQQIKQQVKKEQQVQIKRQQPKIQSQQDRKKRLMEQRQKIKKKKQQQRRKMMEQQESPSRSKVTNIVLQDDGIHDSTFQRNQEKEPEEKIASQQIERRKALMKKIKNRIVDDF